MCRWIVRHRNTVARRGDHLTISSDHRPERSPTLFLIGVRKFDGKAQKFFVCHILPLCPVLHGVAMVPLNGSIGLMTETEDTLRYWLAQEDWYPSRYTQTFLENTPPEEIGDTLARIAADAEPEPHSYAALLYTAFATAGFLPSAGGKIPRRKAGVRAALLLAERDDPRCIPALTRVFETESVWQNKYQEQIVAALTRYLTKAASGNSEHPYGDEVEQLATRIWNIQPNSDLPVNFARLLLSALRYLHAVDLEAPIWHRIVTSDSRHPIRTEIRDTLRSLLDNPAPSR